MIRTQPQSFTDLDQMRLSTVLSVNQHDPTGLTSLSILCNLPPHVCCSCAWTALLSKFCACVRVLLHIDAHKLSGIQPVRQVVYTVKSKVKKQVQNTLMPQDVNRVILRHVVRSIMSSIQINRSSCFGSPGHVRACRTKWCPF